MENYQKCEMGKQKAGGLAVRAGFTKSSLPWWLRLCRPSTYQRGEIPTLRATAAVCRVSISLPVSTRQSTHTAKSRGSRGWLKASGPSFLLLPHFPHARSLASTWCPQHPCFALFLLLLSPLHTPFNPLSNLVSTSARNACECVPWLRTSCTKYAALLKARRWTRGSLTKHKVCLYTVAGDAYVPAAGCLGSRTCPFALKLLDKCVVIFLLNNSIIIVTLSRSGHQFNTRLLSSIYVKSG